jgi:hypothetical protein
MTVRQVAANDVRRLIGQSGDLVLTRKDAKLCHLAERSFLINLRLG